MSVLGAKWFMVIRLITCVLKNVPSLERQSRKKKRMKNVADNVSIKFYRLQVQQQYSCVVYQEFFVEILLCVTPCEDRNSHFHSTYFLMTVDSVHLYCKFCTHFDVRNAIFEMNNSAYFTMKITTPHDRGIESSRRTEEDFNLGD